MKAPDGFPSSSRFWLLHKGLYGLRQAGRQWYLTLHQVYTELEFSHCSSNWSVYTRHSSAFSMSATSVDDILIASDSQIESDLCARQINNKFPTTDCGDAEWILGCRITRCRSKRLLMIDQSQFVSTILRDFGMEHSNPVKTPCPNWQLTHDMCPKNNSEQAIADGLPFCNPSDLLTKLLEKVTHEKWLHLLRMDMFSCLSLLYSRLCFCSRAPGGVLD